MKLLKRIFNAENRWRIWEFIFIFGAVVCIVGVLAKSEIHIGGGAITAAIGVGLMGTDLDQEFI